MKRRECKGIALYPPFAGTSSFEEWHGAFANDIVTLRQRSTRILDRPKAEFL